LAASPALTKIIATLAVGLILREGTRALLGPNAYPFPFLLSPAPVQVGGVLMTPANLAVVGVALGVMVGFYVFFRFARLGKALRAACENRVGAMLVGIPVPFVFGAIWALASVLAAVAGILLAPLVTLTPDMGLVAIKGGWRRSGGFTSLPVRCGGVLSAWWRRSAEATSRRRSRTASRICPHRDLILCPSGGWSAVLSRRWQ
jgi:branched-chain amino acid transport system permease protein